VALAHQLLLLLLLGPLLLLLLLREGLRGLSERPQSPA
jgi:hypothetical protein